MSVYVHAYVSVLRGVGGQSGVSLGVSVGVCHFASQAEFKHSKSHHA